MPVVKLTPEDVAQIRQLKTLRDDLRARASRLSNDALAEMFGVHRRTIEKVLAYATHYRR